MRQDEHGTGERGLRAGPGHPAPDGRVFSRKIECEESRAKAPKPARGPRGRGARPAPDETTPTRSA